MNPTANEPLHNHSPLIALIASTVADRAITLYAFHLETNPLVNALGPSLWIVLTVAFLSFLTWLWFDIGGYEYRIINGGFWIVSSLTTAAFLTNLTVVLS